MRAGGAAVTSTPDSTLALDREARLRPGEVEFPATSPEFGEVEIARWRRQLREVQLRGELPLWL